MQADENKIDKKGNPIAKKEWGIGPELILIENEINFIGNKHTYAPKELGVPHPGIPGGTFTLHQYAS